MQQFFLRSGLFLLLILLSVSPVLWYVSKNFSDKFFHKFEYPAASMILGGSRALYGIDPDAINKANWIKGPVLNFSFTIATSPYGEIYYNAILKKLAEESTNGVFILEVNPVGIANNKLSNNIPERELLLGHMKFFNLDKNVDYILENGGRPLYQFLVDKNAGQEQGEIHHVNGWFESPEKTDSIKFKINIQKGIESYKKVFAAKVISEDRLQWLEKIAVKLSERGKVFLVRMPVAPQMKEMEDKFCPDFNKKMLELASRSGSGFLDFSSKKEFQFKDIHHMTVSSAKTFSVFLGDSLKKLKLN
jgi:hypothetical protein